MMLGVDVGKKELHGTWRDPETRRIRWQGVVPNTEAGIRQMLRRVPDVSVAVEPTGRYGELLIRAAQATGREVLLAAPRKARAFLWSEQPRAKTDRVDSAGLALYGLTGRLRPYLLPSPAVDQVKQLLAARRGLSQSLTSLRQQRSALPLAADVLTPAITALEQQIAALDRQMKRALESATEPTPLQQRARTPATEPTPQCALPAAAAAVTTVTGADTGGVPTAAPRGHSLATAAAALLAVPGIGEVTAPALAACLIDKQFTHPDQFVAYVGLDLRVQQSGQHRGQFGLSKHGDAELRRLLYLAAMSAGNSTHDDTFARRYQREQAKGMSKTAALNAVARKLAKVAWSIVAHGTQYDPKRVDCQPISDKPLDSRP
jgi:transposase